MKRPFGSNTRDTSILRIGIAATVLVGGAISCSVLNAFDEVTAAPVDAGNDVQVDTGTDDAGGSDTSTVDSAPDAAVEAKGVIVVGGIAEGDGGAVPVVTAIQPEDGTELPKAREKMNIAGAYFDGLRELWYLFETSGQSAFPNPGDVVTIHVRSLDTRTGEWTEHQALNIPTMVAYTHVAILRERIVYVAYAGADAAAGTELVFLDTSQPKAITAVIDPMPLDKQPFGLIGTRSNTGAGGTVSLLRSNTCGDASSCIELLHVTVPPVDPPTIGTPYSLRPFFGKVGYGSFIANGTDVIAAADTSGATSFTLTQYYPNVPGTLVGEPIVVGSNDQFIKPLAFAECLKQALIVETNQDLSVIARPMTASVTSQASAPTGHSGQGVYFEPYTNTVLTPFSQGNGYELTAFTLGGTETAPTLTKRNTGWSPPTDLRPEIVATRSPIGFVCPK